MRRARGRTVEVDTAEDLERRLRRGASDLDGWHVRGLDLTGHGTELAALPVAGALFLGCTLPPGLTDELTARGALVFPKVPDVPIDSYRTGLYTPEELYDEAAYSSCLDARVYAWSQHPADDDALLARALHDHAIDQALAGWVSGRLLVGVMGGHALGRTDPGYRDAALLGNGLAGFSTVATGGGPGAMEAANLGAWLTDDDALEEALTVLSAVPSFRPRVGPWVSSALTVRRQWPEGRESLGIPTWHYGHEPPNAFASAIAKYFHNATREAILLALCDGGIVFLPGAGGTLQEIFQDACENYYADESSLAPMVLVGSSYWTRDLPAWPLLQRLATDRPMADRIHLVDTVDEAVQLLTPSVG